MPLVSMTQGNYIETIPMNTTNHCELNTGGQGNEVQCAMVSVRRGTHGAAWEKLVDSKAKREKREGSIK